MDTCSRLFTPGAYLFTGSDSSMASQLVLFASQMCPTGTAWASRAVQDYEAHTDRAVVSFQTTFLDGRELEPVQVRGTSISECSNRGLCDRQTGR
jgi:hypothetical protein